MTIKNIRKLKIHRKYQQRAYGITKIPALRIEGKWLEKLGFKEGAKVNVEQGKNKLVIRLANANE
ncbi:SymE family type I addiction module toxin [Sphingobacterium deserti]|uniref:HSP20-like protein n=1 Tax=Sphingobacterium deserti TaxID=1229276 RepID=A0A0B8T7S4_9SPHI|nr:SymE family type I addiction module toxin [Sphingobacterium deserti]KGE13825.1 HSP20-like protein [Sphingobacterium deserti]